MRVIIAVDDVDLKYNGYTDAWKSLHVEDVVKTMLSLVGGLLVEDGVDVDLWRYRYYGELPYVVKL